MGMFQGCLQEIILALGAASSTHCMEVEVLATGLAGMKADGCKTAQDKNLLTTVVMCKACLGS